MARDIQGDTVNTVVERRNQSRRYMKENLWDELIDVQRAAKCRVPKIYKTDANGKVDTKHEDTSRTNVAMPELALAIRKTTNRLTANPYRLNYIGPDEEVADKLTSLAYQQFDRSGEKFQHYRHVMQAKAFGFSYTKLAWDTVTPMRRFRYDREKVRDRETVMKYMGASPEEIQAAVEQQGPTLTDEEVAQAIASGGPTGNINQQVKKYEGPVVRWVFAGDLFLEPEVWSLNDSGFAIHQYPETDLWLQHMLQVTYPDPETGQPVRAFDPKKCQELLDSDLTIQNDQNIESLRKLFRDSLGMSSQLTMERRLIPGKRFDILEQHCVGDDGRLWIEWVGNEKYLLGKMPYVCDLYGKYNFTEFIPQPDLVTCWGDSSARLLRHIWQMHNRTVAQNFDYISNLIKKFLLVQGTEDLPEAVDRGMFRLLRVRDARSIQYLQEPPLPGGAFEREAQSLRMMALLEPSLNTVDTGTASNPMAGKLATTAMINVKSGDVLTQGDVEMLNVYLKELGEKKLWMNQQMQAWGDPWQIGANYPRSEALSARYGKTSLITLDPQEIQEDFEVEPAVGSMLAVDDEFRQAAASDLVQTALMAPPGTIDIKKVMRFRLSTIRGIGNPDEYILPDAPPNPGANMKQSMTLSVKFETLPADVQNQLFAEMGIQRNPDDVAAEQQLSGVQQLSDAANAAANLHAPAQPEPKPQELPSQQ